ncbi:MAG: UbiD family decarboxylase [Betaproteobacteria bacterium]|nr:UbiD family decarboxylase [Betaproteobacteria bacterium]
MTLSPQDLRHFLAAYRREHADDMLVLGEPVTDGQDLTALVWQLAARGRHPVLLAPQVWGADVAVVTNLFASRERIGRMLGCAARGIHATYQAKASNLIAPEVLETGPVLDEVAQGDAVDLSALPMLRHFETDRAAYITNAVIVAEDPQTGRGNLSYHRSMRHSATELATSLHSRGHLWRMQQAAKARGEPLPVAMVIGAHPLFMLAAAARVPYGTDERQVAGGLFGAPLQCVRTPRHGLLVPAHAEFVLEGVIDPEAKVEEGPFGEFTGYSSNRSTNHLLRVHSVLRRRDAMLVDVVGGNSAEHLNLGRVPRESEMVTKLKERFPSVTAVHYPASGTHFHAYVALKQARDGEARQVMLGLLGWDPYLKTVIAVDDDVDVTRDEEVLWALAAHFQPHRDVLVIDGLPGSALDPSATAGGTTSRMGLDATRGMDFEGVRATIAPAAMERAAALLSKLGINGAAANT